MGARMRPSVGRKNRWLRSIGTSAADDDHLERHPYRLRRGLNLHLITIERMYYDLTTFKNGWSKALPDTLAP